MRTWKIIAWISFGLALAAAGVGLATTAQLIEEYGNNVSPLNLAAQAALVWLPPAIALTAFGRYCWRKPQG